MKIKNNRFLTIFFALIIFFLGFLVRGFFFDYNQETIFTPSDKTKNILLPEPKEGFYLVEEVIDGDTVRLETGEKFRYLGIDAPEPNERWGPEAKKFNEELVLKKRVKVELDKTKIDLFGRILGYLWVDNLLVNEALVDRGYAKINLLKDEAKPKYLERLQKAETRARQNHDGVWFDEWEKEKGI